MTNMEKKKKTVKDKNLKSYGKEIDPPTHDVAVKNGRKGGIASGKARREKADMRRALELALSMNVKGDVRKLLEELGYDADEMTNANAIAATIVAMGLNGDHKALDTMMNYLFAASEDERKTKESEARIESMRANIGANMQLTSSDDDDGDVVIYLPQIEGEPEDEGIQASEDKEE